MQAHQGDYRLQSLVVKDDFMSTEKYHETKNPKQLHPFL